MLQAFLLHVRIVQFRIAGGNFLPVDHQFIYIHYVRIFPVQLGQGNQVLGHVGNKAGVHGLFLHQFFIHLLGNIHIFHIRADFHSQLFTAGAARFGGNVKPVFPCHAPDQVLVVGAFPGTAEVDCVKNIAFSVLVVNLKAAAEFFRQMADELLHHIRHGFKITAGAIGFQHGEFRVVAAVNSFIAEAAVEFENFREAAHHQAFEEKLRGNAQRQRHIQRVMVRFKRLGGGPTGHILKHGGFHFQITAFLEKAADFRNHEGARHEQGGAFLIGNEVQVALAVGHLLVRQPVPLVRQGAEAFGKNGQSGYLYGRFSGTGQERGSPDADPVPAVQELPKLPGGFIHLIFMQEPLDFSPYVPNDEKLGFAHVANSQKAAGDGYLFVFLEIGFQSGGSGGHVKSCAVGVNSQLTDFGELVAAHGNKFGFRRSRMCLLLFGHSAGILKACFRFG